MSTEEDSLRSPTAGHGDALATVSHQKLIEAWSYILIPLGKFFFPADKCSISRREKFFSRREIY